MQLASLFDRAFPAPRFLTPRSVGVDISDFSIKWLTLAPDLKSAASWGDATIAEGILKSGVILDMPRFVEALKALKAGLKGVTHVHAALPEEPGYVFTMTIPPGTKRDQAERMIEFEFEGRVPIPVSASTYDFEELDAARGAPREIAVTVFARELVESYAHGFNEAGLVLSSLEIEARSIGRAIASGEPGEIVLIADIGRLRTGIAILKGGIPLFASTAEVGGNVITRAIQEKLGLSPEDTERFKNEQGLFPDGGKVSPGFEAVIGPSSALVDEIARYYRFWDSRRDEKGVAVSPISRVILLGGSSNLRGLEDYVAGRIQAPVEHANVWRHVASFDEYIPPIDRMTSLEYATALGLALRA